MQQWKMKEYLLHELRRSLIIPPASSDEMLLV